MHESPLVSALISKILAVATEQHASKIISLTVKIGALSHISPTRLREHFIHAAHGTIAEEAQLNIEALTDTTDPLAQEVLLESIDIA
ncbi:MAG: hydrogenase maturation nickel metallochaperone HypA [Planctomycetota bacterium]|jgi:hydrogenase nickel incorporation protein HypA/HybF